MSSEDFSCFVCGTTAGFRVFTLQEGASATFSKPYGPWAAIRCRGKDGASVAERLRRDPCPRSSTMNVAMLYKSSALR